MAPSETAGPNSTLAWGGPPQAKQARSGMRAGNFLFMGPPVQKKARRPGGSSSQAAPRSPSPTAQPSTSGRTDRRQRQTRTTIPATSAPPTIPSSRLMEAEYRDAAGGSNLLPDISLPITLVRFRDRSEQVRSRPIRAVARPGGSTSGPQPTWKPCIRPRAVPNASSPPDAWSSRPFRCSPSGSTLPSRRSTPTSPITARRLRRVLGVIALLVWRSDAPSHRLAGWSPTRSI